MTPFYVLLVARERGRVDVAMVGADSFREAQDRAQEVWPYEELGHTMFVAKPEAMAMYDGWKGRDTYQLVLREIVYDAFDVVMP